VFVRCAIECPLVWKSHEEVAASVLLALSPTRRPHRAKGTPSKTRIEHRSRARHSETGEPIGPPEGATPAELEEWERWEREEYDEEQRRKAEQQALIAELERKRKAGL